VGDLEPELRLNMFAGFEVATVGCGNIARREMGLFIYEESGIE
jgi:hypothetical protein